MTENDKKALLRDINGIFKILQQAKNLRMDIAKNILLLNSNEVRFNAVNTQIELLEVFNNLHELVHCYIDVADQEGYEVIWKGYKAVKLEKKENREDQEGKNDRKR